MNALAIQSRFASARTARRERGIVLFVALIAMVVMSFAGVALVRSVDTSTSVARNLVFRQASIPSVNSAIEVSMDALFKNKVIADPTNDMPAQNYYASLQAGEGKNAVPAVLQGQYPPPAYPGAFQKLPADNAGNTSLYVIERVCNAAGPPTLANCDLLAPKQALGKTSMKLSGPQILPLPFYRVTVRVDGPANTTTFAQAMIR
jgi:Tfp pilus assembly protein PilX